MARRRLGVVLLVPPPVAGEVDGLRRACGDPMLGRVAAHLTMVPPVNVREEDLPLALASLRRAAAEQRRPLVLELGPPATFHPVTPVLYLAVGGDDAELAALQRLRTAVFVPPLDRPLTHPFRPHVTVGDEVDEGRIGPSVVALSRFQVTAAFDRVHLLEERRGRDGVRRWPPIADAAFEPTAVVGTGGLPIELTASDLVDPEAMAAAAAAAGVATEPDAGLPVGLTEPPQAGERSVVVTARREGAVLGVARGIVGPGAAEQDGRRVTWVGVGAEHRRQGVARQLLAHLHHRMAAGP